MDFLPLSQAMILAKLADIIPERHKAIAEALQEMRKKI
jgi:hypothetical protein